MHVCVDVAESEIAALVSCTSESHSLHWLYSFDDLLDGVTEVTERCSDSDYAIFLRHFVVIERNDVLWDSRELLLLGHVLVVEKLECSCLSCTEYRLALSFVLCTVWIVDDADATLVFD